MVLNLANQASSERFVFASQVISVSSSSQTNVDMARTCDFLDISEKFPRQGPEKEEFFPPNFVVTKSPCGFHPTKEVPCSKLSRVFMDACSCYRHLDLVCQHDLFRVSISIIVPPLIIHARSLIEARASVGLLLY
jgi:hypothetical protein